jgi:Photoprotection regulator fluorescence recovery protein
MHDLKWSGTEKAAARKAFDAALDRELNATMREARERAARITEPSQLWKLEAWLSERRREIERTYDYRYSVLPLVFARLIREGLLDEDELHGLGPDKLDYIRRAATL